MSEGIVLFGAGVTGRFLKSRMTCAPLAFVDNDPDKQGKEVEGIKILSPEEGVKSYPDALWIPAAMQSDYGDEISEKINSLGVKTMSLWTFLPEGITHIPQRSYSTIRLLIGDMQSHHELINQMEFRRDPNLERQLPPSDIKDLYFPDFITHRDDEKFIDCGAADGDTVKEFIERWEKWDSIVAFEPDYVNFNKLYHVHDPEGKGRITTLGFAVSDIDGYTEFVVTGDYSAHLGEGDRKVRVTTLDQMCELTFPTYIKMDIEGAELKALWGARRILKEHKPVLAICAYHKSDHLWEIPLLIHALQPEYKLYFRRYSKGDFELVWYAVPPERIVK
jgi:FkbM family methyltransferase